MTERSRRAYLMLGRVFVVLGSVVVLASLVDRAASWGFFRANPIGTASFLVMVGVLLLWTVRQAERGGHVVVDAAPEDGPEPGGEEVDSEPGGGERLHARPDGDEFDPEPGGEEVDLRP